MPVVSSVRLLPVWPAMSFHSQRDGSSRESAECTDVVFTFDALESQHVRSTDCVLSAAAAVVAVVWSATESNAGWRTNECHVGKSDAAALVVVARIWKYWRVDGRKQQLCRQRIRVAEWKFLAGTRPRRRRLVRHRVYGSASGQSTRHLRAAATTAPAPAPAPQAAAAAVTQLDDELRLESSQC